MDTPEDNLILAVNSGSSSLKFGLFRKQKGEEGVILRGGVDGIGTQDGRLRVSDTEGRMLFEEAYTLTTQGQALRKILRALPKFTQGAPAAVGHRVVHGGPRLREHQRITDNLLDVLESAVHFAPLHISAALALIHDTRQVLPRAQQYACFDTAFHATMPETAYRLALPQDFYHKGIQRYGFHGLSYESVVHRLGDRIPSRVVCAHLGNGASLVALRDGRSIDTTMGLTPTGGIPMATRSGDLDPGVLLFLMRTEGMTADALENLLNRQAGLVALSAGDSDMRSLQTRMEAGDNCAGLAIDVFCGAVRKCIGAYAVELGGLDLLVFTGGIGEHSQYIRERICKGLEFLGVKIMAAGQISKVAVMTSEEEIQIARHCRRLMRIHGSS